VIDSLVNELKPTLIAEVYSTHFPIVYQTKPAYASHHGLPGIGGINVEVGGINFPKIQFYVHTSPPLIITRGYHANFNGQYEVAEAVLDVLEELRVKRMIVVAGYGAEGEQVCCAATNRKTIDEVAKTYGIEVGYVGPFYGFSGMVFGLAKLREIDALCLFGRTEPVPEDPECPDEEASTNVLNKLTVMLNLPTTTE
jgi:proteasome assembly chaperone (PAC2) family protein